MAASGFLVISELLLPTKGGTAVWFSEVYGRLGGKETHIITADVPNAQGHDQGHPNTIHRLNLRRYAWLKPESLLAYARMIGVALFLALRHRFVAVHAGRILPEGLAAFIVARIARLPLVIYAHGEEITGCRNPRKMRIMSHVYQRADRVIANSDFTRDELLDMGVHPERIVVIAPGVDLERFRPGLAVEDLRRQLALAPEQALILSVGRLQRRKGFDQVIRALPALLAKGCDVHYAVIGIGVDEDYFRQVAKDTGVEPRVHMLGHVPAEDLPRWYNAASVFAMPNRDVNGDTEGFGMVYLEAAACGIPALAGIAGGTGGAVVDGVTGIRVDGESVAAVADALETLLRDESASARLGEAAYRRAVAEFGWDSVAQKTAALTLQIDAAPGDRGKA